MNKNLNSRELFQQIIKQLEEEQIFLTMRGNSIYLVQSNTFQKHQIKIGQLVEIQTRKYNQSCNVDWNQEFKDYWKKKPKDHE